MMMMRMMVMVAVADTSQDGEIKVHFIDLVSRVAHGSNIITV